ncbi:MAG: glycosyltransferase [Candidatus Portnoybacteria bacterium]|nr:glycosyltransferase [Candidatus Portnoybacteria bacterium]MDD4983036.1 glycosyltransferase [Candidatus Portnoybacteria bacterium]
MRIAIFSDTFPPQTTNGVANVAYQSAKGLADRGHEVMVFTVSKDASRHNDSTRKNLSICYLPSLPALVYGNERLSFPIGFSFNRLRKFKPDIIHTHTPFSVGLEAVMCAKFFKVPLVGTHHTFYDHYLKHIGMNHDFGKKLSWKLTVSYYNRCDLILSPSQSLANAMVSKGLKKLTTVLKNSIDTKLFHPVKDNETKEKLKRYFGIEDRSVAYMGRLSYEKSIDQVIKAFPLMLEEMPSLKLMLIGDGPEKDKLKKLAEKLGVADNVIFTGFVYGETLARALQTNDVFITASKSENMPLSVLEAMSAGLPIVAAKENGLAEIVEENTNGFFARTDDPADIAQKTLAILSSPELLGKFSEGSRRLVMEYSEEKILTRLEDYYKELLK